MIKVGCLGVTGVMCAMFLRELKSPFSAFVSFGTCLIIAYFGLGRLEPVMDMLNTLKEELSLSPVWFRILLKITGITYLADLSAALCRDAGYSALAGQIEIYGKLAILAVSAPVMLSLLECVRAFV